MRKTAAGYGKGVLALDDEDAELLLGPEELIEIIEAPSYTPPMLPAIALEILELSRSPDLDLRRVLRVLERDPMVASKVLRVAQSPFYASRVAITSLSDALNRLGVETLSHIVLEATMGMSVFRVPGYEAAVEGIRRHSVATAYAARAIAHASGLPRELAFLCGLIHDVGIVACLLVYARPRPGRRPPSVDLVLPIVLPLHEGVSGRLARRWNLPEEVQTVMRGHHPQPGTRPRPLAAVVGLADTLTCELGAGTEPTLEPALATSLRSSIGFPEAALEELTTYTRQVIERIE